MNICLSICLFLGLFCLQDYANTTGWTFLKKSEDGSWSDLDPIKFWSGVDHSLKTKKKIFLIFPFTYYYVPWWRYVLSKYSYPSIIFYAMVH